MSFFSVISTKDDFLILILQSVYLHSLGYLISNEIYSTYVLHSIHKLSALKKILNLVLKWTKYMRNFTIKLIQIFVKLVDQKNSVKKRTH